MNRYPIEVDIETPDGEGEAVKRAQGAPWVINTPTRSFLIYGTTAQMRAVVRHCLTEDYPDEARPVIFAHRSKGQE